MLEHQYRQARHGLPATTFVVLVVPDAATAVNVSFYIRRRIN